MRILGLPNGVNGAAYYRVFLPLTHLERHSGGEHVISFPEPAAAGKLGGTWIAGHDVIVGQCIARNGAGMWESFRDDGEGALVYESDDDLITPIDERYHPSLVQYNQPELRESHIRALRASDLVTVSTPVLGERLSKYNPNVVVLPNRVNADLLTLEGTRRERVTVGWQGSATHLGDMRFHREPIRRFFRQNPQVDLHIIGGDYRETLGLPQARFTPWMVDMWDYYAAVDFDIGLAPLMPNSFNEAKCVDSSMRISTNRGVLEAGSLEPGMKVWRDGWCRIEAVQHDVPRPGFLLRMADGYQLKLTPEHRMLVDGEWKPASQIRSGDVIAMEAESAHSGEPVRIPWPADSRMSRAYKGRPPADPDAFLTAEDGPKLDITPRWGRFLGAFAGDGSVGQATVIAIHCDGQDQDWIDLLMDDLRAFGLNPRTEEIKTFSGEVLRARSVAAASAHLLRVLASMGVTAPRPSGKPIRVPCVPEVIWRSPKPVIAEFLAAYFEADGHCTSSGVQVISKTEQLIRDVQRLLLLFGITSTVRSRIYKAQNGHSGLYWLCNLLRAETDIFAKEIGFRSQRKSARLAEITGRRHSNAYRPMRWSRRVALIEQCFVDPVDIQVEGSTFVLAGFVSHNSGIKALEYAARGIPVVASDVTAYRDIVVDGVTGFLVRRDHEWGQRLRELVSDEAMRAEMGAKAREHASHHTIQEHWPSWLAAYRKVA